MLQTLINRQIEAMEIRLGVPLEYLRFIAAHSRSAFFKFGLFMPLANHHRIVPPEALLVAHLVAVRHQDCGSCVQIAFNMAGKYGVPDAVMRAAWEDRPEALPDGPADAYRFACAVVDQDAEAADALRERIRSRYGDEGLVELSLALATAQVFPIAKRGLGFAESCALVAP
jgi:hypothetical protein